MNRTIKMNTLFRVQNTENNLLGYLIVQMIRDRSGYMHKFMRLQGNGPGGISLDIFYD